MAPSYEMIPLQAEPAQPRVAPRKQILKIALWLVLGFGALYLVTAGLLFLAEKGALGERAERWVYLERTRSQFNRLYSLPDPPFEQGPNDFLVKATSSLPRGEALVIACGQGRNAVYLAHEGWNVTAFDIADKGLEIARRTAQRDGVPLKAELASAEEFDYGRNRWSLVVFLYSPIRYDDPDLLRRIKDSIKPGGYVVVEMPLETRNDPAGRRRHPGELLPGELPALFSGFEIVQFQEAVGVSDFFHDRTLIGRMLARKP